MDRYEFKLKAEEIKKLINEGRYSDAVQIADTIKWKDCKSVRMLCTISDLYKINRRYHESRDILLIAREIYPDGRYIIYSLCELCIKLQDIVPALEYYKEFVRIAPQNTSRYILKYKLFVAQDVSVEEQIAVLQEFKKHDYREKWGYQLAFLYHRLGMTTACVEECDELFLWFGSGPYVMKALELKKLHEPMSPEQKKVYDRYRAGVQGIPEESEKSAYDSERDEMGHDEKAPEEDGEFHVKTFDVGQNNTINLQQVIAESLKELSQPADGKEISQETRVMQEVARRISTQEPAAVDSTGDTGVLGITDEDLEAYEEASAEKEQAANPPEKVTEEQALDSFKKTAQSIASDDTIWMPGIPEMAKYAQQVAAERAGAEAGADKDAPQKAGLQSDAATGNAVDSSVPEEDETEPAEEVFPEEISDKIIAQATGELPMAETVDQVKPPVHDDPVKKALQAPRGMTELSASGQAPVGRGGQAAGKPDPSAAAEAAVEKAVTAIAADNASAEQQLVQALQAEMLQGADEARRLRAAERRAELKSREKNSGMREVSSDTRRMGQTRKYVPVSARMDQAVEEALSDKKESPAGRVLTPVPATKEEGQAPAGARVSQVVRPNRKDGSGYDNLLAESSDGQLSMAVEERSGLERQITGQISIEQFLTGWETYKAEQQRRQVDGIREQVKRDTDELFKSYDEQARNDLIHQLENAQEDAIRKERGEEQEEKAEENAGADVDEQEVLTATSQEEPAEAPEQTEAAEDGAKEEKRKPTPEEIAHQLAILEGRIPADAPSKAITAEADEQVLKNAEGEAAQPVADAEAVEDAIRAAAQEDAASESAKEEESADNTEPLTLKKEELFPEDEDESPSGEDTEDSAEADGEDDTYAPLEIPADEEADTGDESGASEGEDEHVLRVMTPEEKELFGPYIHRKRSRRQIITAIDSLSMAAYTGNVILTGEEGAGTINLAKGLIRSIQLSDANFSGQIAKISGRAMNRKRVDAIVEKLAGGALIVQGAGGMNNETTKILLKALQSENTGIVVVLEDTRKDMEKYLKKHPELTEVFNVRVDVEALATRELVSYARQYALDKEFSMDEFAVLALHKRIDEMQTAEHEVTIAEVRAIVEEAIRRAIRKNPAHFFDILLQKRYDEEDMIILREKDFLR